jgi:hypothetical protein
MRFLDGPELTLRNERYRRQDDRAIPAVLDPQSLSRIVLPERYLTALPDDLNLCSAYLRHFRSLPAIMLSCSLSLPPFGGHPSRRENAPGVTDGKSSIKDEAVADGVGEDSARQPAAILPASKRNIFLICIRSKSMLLCAS